MTNTTYLTDRKGFPMTTCERCLGEGVLRQHGAIMDGVCFSCKGRKGHYPKGTAGNIARKFYVDAIASREKIDATALVNLAPGTKILDGGKWRTLATAKVDGAYISATFANGYEVSYAPTSTFFLPPTTTPAETEKAAAKARAAYEATLR